MQGLFLAGTLQILTKVGFFSEILNIGMDIWWAIHYVCFR